MKAEYKFHNTSDLNQNIHNNLNSAPEELLDAIGVLNSKATNTLAIITRDGTRIEFKGRGVADLWDILKSSPEALKGAFVADKVIGKAAAAIMIAGGVRAIHTRILSELASELLSAAPIEVYYDTSTSHIINRTKSGWCPLETTCRDCRTVRMCLEKIDKFINQQKAINELKK